MYHGIIIDKSFKDANFVKTFKIFNQKQDGSFGIYGIEVEDSKLDETINLIQKNLNDGSWYCHFYNAEKLIVIFKDKTFKVKPDISTWNPIIDYGKEVNIPTEQLDFYPNRFQDEIHYFKV